MTNAGGPPTRNNGEKRLAKLSSASKMAATVTVCGRVRTPARLPTGRGGAHPPNGPFLPYSPNVVEEVFCEVRELGVLGISRRGWSGGIMLIGGNGQDSLKASGVGKENTRVGAGDGGMVSPVARATQGRVGRKDLRKLHRVHGDLEHLRR